MELAYLNPVSIPLWFDWKKVFVLKVNAVKVVSIPLWFDWKLMNLNKLLCLFRGFNSTLVRLEVELQTDSELEIVVSIPLWFDWKSMMLKPCSFGLWFQFHFGSIGRLRPDYRSNSTVLFQFHFGSIGRGDEKGI